MVHVVVHWTVNFGLLVAKINLARWIELPITSSCKLNCNLIDVKISRIDGCSVKRVADMEFNFNYGACNTFQFDIEKILFCFGTISGQHCHTWVKNHFTQVKNKFRFDGQLVESANSTMYSHSYITHLASYRGQPLVTGNRNSVNYTENHTKTEILNLETGKWRTEANYPFSTM